MSGRRSKLSNRPGRFGESDPWPWLHRKGFAPFQAPPWVFLLAGPPGVARGRGRRWSPVADCRACLPLRAESDKSEQITNEWNQAPTGHGPDGTAAGWRKGSIQPAPHRRSRHRHFSHGPTPCPVRIGTPTGAPDARKPSAPPPSRVLPRGAGDRPWAESWRGSRYSARRRREAVTERAWTPTTLSPRPS